MFSSLKQIALVGSVFTANAHVRYGESKYDDFGIPTDPRE